MTIVSSIDDLFDEGSEGRSWALFASSLTSNIGLVIGPIFASQIAVAFNWYSHPKPRKHNSVMLIFLLVQALALLHLNHHPLRPLPPPSHNQRIIPK